MPTAAAAPATYFSADEAEDADEEKDEGDTPAARFTVADLADEVSRSPRVPILCISERVLLREKDEGQKGKCAAPKSLSAQDGDKKLLVRFRWACASPPVVPHSGGEGRRQWSVDWSSTWRAARKYRNPQSKDRALVGR